jgi:hypothetical protein
LYSKTDHLLYANLNNGGEVQVPTATSTATLTNKTYDTAGTGNSFKINGTSITSVAGNTAKVQLAGSGTPATNDCAKFDASGNIVTAGAACGSGSGSTNMQLLYSGGAGTTSCPSAITTLNAGTYTPSTVSFATGDTIVVRAVIKRTGSAGTNNIRLIIGWDGADSANQTNYGYIRETTADTMLQYTARIRITSSSSIMTATTAEWGFATNSLLSTSTGLTFSSQPTITIRSSNCSSTDTVNVVLFEVWKFTGGVSL